MNFPLYIMMYIFKLNIEIALCIHNVINSNYKYTCIYMYVNWIYSHGTIEHPFFLVARGKEISFGLFFSFSYQFLKLK